MRPLASGRATGAVAIAGLIVPAIAWSVFGGLLPLAAVVLGAGISTALRFAVRLRSDAWVALPALGGAAVAALLVPVSPVVEILATVTALGLLFWIGASGRTLATHADRVAGLALPGFAASLALTTAIAFQSPGSVYGIVVAGVMVLAILVAMAVLIARPTPAAPPSS